jgi:LmbE family N-acetylglucosaminyl deacetylase
MRVLVVAAHPDDEVLGAGGTLARHAAQGDAVEVLICAQGLASRPGGATADALEALREAARKAAAALGAHAPRFLDLPDNAMDSVPLLDVVRRVEAVVADVRPDVVYTHHASDLNVDHRLAAQAVLTACRPVPGATVRAIYAFETPSSTEWAVPGAAAPFAPSHFVDVSATMEHKVRALGAYAAELRPFPHPRSIEAVRHLAAWRGATVGCAAAEAFVALRTLWPAEGP